MGKLKTTNTVDFTYNRNRLRENIQNQGRLEGEGNFHNNQSTSFLCVKVWLKKSTKTTNKCVLIECMFQNNRYKFGHSIDQST